jgi:hypothetical protein
LQDLGIDGRLSKGIFKKELGEWIALILLRTGPGGGSCECGNELPGSIKCREFLD